MANYKTSAYLTGNNRKMYSKYYGVFRGVDFSSDHTQVHDSRFAYAVNMYKDYKSGQGGAIETIPGFRRRLEMPGGDEIFGIHEYKYRDGGEMKSKYLIHSGTKMYLWDNYPASVNVVNERIITLPEETEIINTTKEFNIDLGAGTANVTTVKIASNGTDIFDNMTFDSETHILTVARSDLSEGDRIIVYYKEKVITTANAIYHFMNPRKSVSFMFDNYLYILDGKGFYYCNGTSISLLRNTDGIGDNNASYIPTTYRDIWLTGENAGKETEYEQRNLLNPLFRHTFVADGTTTVYPLRDNDITGIVSVKVYGTVKEVNTDYTVDLTNGTVTFTTAPSAPGTNGYPDDYAGVEIIANKPITSITGLRDPGIDGVYSIIPACTMFAIYDDRVFLSGNPLYPNHIFWCSRSNVTGMIDPTYFGWQNFIQDGAGKSGITGMIVVADTLAVLKSDSVTDATIYYHKPYETGYDLIPTEYPSTSGLGGIGCLGGCANFLDDPVFISTRGLDAVGQLSVRLERAVEHRSSNVDAKLTNLDLKDADITVWNGYLLILIDGKIFMADSRQKYQNANGNIEYEWYYLEDIGVYTGQTDEYRYADRIYDELVGAKVKYCPHVGGHDEGEDTDSHVDHLTEDYPLTLADNVYNASTDMTSNLVGTVAETSNVHNGTAYVDGTAISGVVPYVIHGNSALLCMKSGAKNGGTFCPAKRLYVYGDNLYFGTDNGIVCSFNFDKRDADSGEIAPEYYTFDGRTIFSGCATKMDCCGIPHLTKNTVKKSVVIKTRAKIRSAAKIKVRTNRKMYEQIARISSSRFALDDIDFADFSFETADRTLFSVGEKEKKWVEKQYFIYSDEYMRPFSLYYIAYRYEVAGRYKE